MDLLSRVLTNHNDSIITTRRTDLVRFLPSDVFIALSIVQPLIEVVKDSFRVAIEEGNRALRHKLGFFIIVTLLHDPSDVGRVQCVEIDVCLHSTVD